MSPLVYHQSALEVLQQQPVIDDTAVQELNHLEAAYQIKLPLAVREWYSLPFAVDALNVGNLTDFAVPVVQLGHRRELLAQYGQTIENGFLTIMQDYQGSAHWCVRLDGSDDPPVVAREPDSNEAWQIASPSFSECVFGVVWDNQLHKGCYLMTNSFHGMAHPLSDQALQFLGEHYTPISARYNHRRVTTRRFVHDDKAIRINIWPELGDDTDWCLHASSAESLYLLAHNLWHCDSLNLRLRADGQYNDSQAVLDRLSGKWEYQLACSYSANTAPLNQAMFNYLRERLTLKEFNGNYVNGSGAYCFADDGKQLLLANWTTQNLVYWRLKAESLPQLENLARLVWQWPTVANSLAPDTYASSYLETVTLLARLRAKATLQQ